MIFLLLDDPDEFRVKSRLGHIRISDMETGKQTVISARKAGAIQRQIGESRDQLQYLLKHRCGIDSVVLTPREPYRGAAKVPDRAHGTLGDVEEDDCDASVRFGSDLGGGLERGRAAARGSGASAG